MGKPPKPPKPKLGPDGQPFFCYLCRERVATTWDHVPPQNLFPKNAQFKGFKLPACKPCNEGLSKDDEYFRDVLTMAATNEDARQVLQEGTIPSITRPWAQVQRVRKVDRILEKTVAVPYISPSGLIVEPRIAFQFDTERTDRVCARIVRGIYYYIAKAPLADECEIVASLTRARDVNETLDGLMKSYGEPKVVHSPDDVCRFAMWGTAEDRHMSSLWLMQFYDQIHAMVMVQGPAYFARRAQISQDGPEGQEQPRDE